jgi:hypothetical protein
VKNSNGGMKQFGKPARHGHRCRRLSGAIERTSMVFMDVIG